MVLGHEGAGTVEAVGEGVVHVAPGDRVVFCMIPSCGACSACRAGRPTLCGPAGEAGLRGTLMDGTSRLVAAGRDAAPARPHRRLLRRARRRRRRRRRAAGADVPLWQAALLGCGAVTGIGAVRNVARPRIGERAAVIGCGGVGQQVIAGLVLAGAGAIVAVDRDPAMLELALARGATHAVDARADDPAADVRELTGGGVDHAFEVVGRPETMRLAWDCLRAGGTAVVVGLAAVGVEASFPAIEFLSDKGIKGCYYGSGNPSVELASLVQLAADGRLVLADVVTHMTDLEGIPEGLERLRTRGGGRTVAILDAEAAGVGPEPRDAAPLVHVRDDVHDGPLEVLAHLLDEVLAQPARARRRVRGDHDHVGLEAVEGVPHRRERHHVADVAVAVETLAAQHRERAVEPLLRGLDRAGLVPGAEPVIGRDGRRDHAERRAVLVLDPAQLGEQLLGFDGLVRDHEHARHAPPPEGMCSRCYKRLPGDASADRRYSIWPTANEVTARTMPPIRPQTSNGKPSTPLATRISTIAPTIPKPMTRIAILPSFSSTCSSCAAPTAHMLPSALARGFSRRRS